MQSTSALDDVLATNLQSVHARIAAAAARAGRLAQDVRLVAVTKSVPIGIIQRLVLLGARDLGENRIHDAAEKIREVDALGPRPAWHLIGHLQSNKVRRAVRMFACIHSVDSVALLDRIDETAAQEGRAIDVLLQVNVSGEATKSGVSLAELPKLVERASNLRAVRPAGLMTIAPMSDDPENARPHFHGLAAQLEFASRRLGPEFRELSMGMTDDFEVAIEEGATLVRVGRALFQGLPATWTEA